MITTEGKNHIRRYLAGYVPYIASSISVGIGSTAATALDKVQDFEATRTDITSTTYNFATNKLIFKAPLPPEFGGKIYEVSLYSSPSNVFSAFSRLLVSFDSVREDWRDNSSNLPASYSSTNARIGGDALLQTPTANNSTETYLRNLNFDFSRNPASDVFSFAYSVVNTNSSGARVVFMTDSSNYYNFSLSGGEVNSIGYKISKRAKSSAQVVGSPDWGKITEIRVITSAGNAGQADLEWDGIRIDSPNTYGLDNILVARKVLTTPVTTLVGQPQDIEYALDINL